MSRELTQEQAQAVELRDRHVFCRAGAGTGKTSALVERFVAAICDDGVEMSAMLAFTFTERAADQLRRRIRAALRLRAAEAQSAGDADRARELDLLARGTDNAWISTIHGFCRRLLASHPVAAGIDPRFRVLDGGEASRLAARAFRAALDDMLGGPNAEIAGRTIAAIVPRDLEKIVATAHDELRSRGHHSPELPLPDPPDVEAAVAGLGSAAAEALAECAESAGRYTEMLERIERASEIAADPGGARLDDVLAIELTSGAGPFKNDPCDRYRTAWAAARRALAHAELSDSYEFIRELLAAYARHYGELKEERSGLDFEDLQLRATALLESSDSVREDFQARFSHILVDEFQDTNELQLRLVRLLTGPESRVFFVGDELQSIYGFRHADLEVFREEGRRFESMPPDQGRVVALTGNFRSAPGILAAINALGGTLIPGFQPLTAGAPADRAAEPEVELLLTADEKKDWEADEVGLELAPDDPAPAQRVAEARLLAQRLRELHEKGVPRSDIVVLLRSYTAVSTYEQALDRAGLRPYVIGGRGYWSSQQVEDVLALLGVIANPLDDEALLGALAGPGCGVGPDTLWMLRRVALDRSGERSFSARVWPAVGEVVAGESPEGSKSARWSAEIDPAERERLTRFHLRVQELRREAPLLGLDGMIDAVCERLRYDLATLMRDGGGARWANVRKLMRLAREFEANEGADLRGFLAYARDEGHRAADGEAPTEAEEHDGVRIMTVHAAKGLEFGVVAVPELGRRLLHGSPPPIRIRPHAPAEGEGEEASSIQIGLRLARLGNPNERLFDFERLSKEAELAESAEELRLAHVAATRAERLLILSGTFKPNLNRAKERKPGDPIIERLMLDLNGGSLLDGAEGGESGRFEIGVPPPEPRPGLEHDFEPGRIAVTMSFPEPGAGEALSAIANPAAGETTAPEPFSPPLLEMDPPPASGARLSYSAISLYQRCGYRFWAERELGLAPVEPRGGAAARERDPGAEGGTAREIRFGFGNAVHRLLERSARSNWIKPGGETVGKVLVSEGLQPDGPQRERVDSLVGAWLGSPLCEELRSERSAVRPEAPFVMALGQTLIRGSIDLLVTEPDGSATIVDYKTDALAGDDPAERAASYRVQQDIYALAVAGGAGGGNGEAPIVRVAYSFLEDPENPVIATYGPAELAAATSRLTELLDGINSGHFTPTDRPHAKLCRDCPARLRLCSHDKEATLRESPEPPIDPSAPDEDGEAAADATQPVAPAARKPAVPGASAPAGPVSPAQLSLDETL